MRKKIEILKMPKWGMTMAEGNIVSWLKVEGDCLAKGEEIVEIETGTRLKVPKLSRSRSVRDS